MDNKFYVSLEAARLMKEKGYRDKTMYGYDSKDQSKNTLDVREDYDWNAPDNEFHSTETREYVEMFAAPTKAEAIDWLESKGIGISIIFCEIEMYEYVVESKDCYYTVVESGYKETRLEAEEAAIIGALKLL